MKTILYILASFPLLLLGQEVVFDYSEIQSEQDSLWSFRREVHTTIAGSSKYDTLITHSTPLDSVSMGTQLQGIASQENEELGEAIRELYRYNSLDAAFLDYDTLIQRISDSTIFDYTAQAYEDFFTSLYWKIIDTAITTVTFSYAGDITMSSGGDSWTVEVYSTSEIIIKDWKGEDIRLYRTGGTDNPIFQSLGYIIPWTEPEYRLITLKGEQP